MGAQLHHGRTRAAHIEDLDVAAVLVEGAHVVRVARVERDAQERGRWWAAGRGLVFGRGRLVEDGAVLEAAQVECTQGAVRADRDEYIRRAWQPSDIVHLAVVRDQLRHRRRRIEVPHGARRVDRGCDHQTRYLLVPRKVCQRGTAALALYFRLLDVKTLRRWGFLRRLDRRYRTLTPESDALSERRCPPPLGCRPT